MSKKQLGRGLGALISLKTDESEDKTTGITTIKISKISPNRYQPRIEFDNEKLKDLASSIKENGIIQPLVVTKQDNTNYELIAGQRRLEASKLAGYTKVPVIVRSVSKQEQLQLAIIENVQRENLNPIEEAKAYKELSVDFSLTHSEIAKVTGKSRTTISNLLRVLKLPDEVQNLLFAQELTLGHARAILQVEEEKQSAFANYILEKGLSVRASEKIAKTFEKEDTEKPKQVKKSYNKFSNFEDFLVNRFKTKVKIKDKNDKGKIEFHYKNADERERILDKLKNE